MGSAKAWFAPVILLAMTCAGCVTAASADMGDATVVRDTVSQLEETGLATVLDFDASHRRVKIRSRVRDPLTLEQILDSVCIELYRRKISGWDIGVSGPPPSAEMSRVC